VLIPQAELSVERICEMLSIQEQEAHYSRGLKAYSLRKTDATEALVAACEALQRGTS
jgi:hypothetical protein